MIKSIRDAGGTALYVLILEAVDNSFDAMANDVVIVVGNDTVTIADNGHGIVKDEIQAAITLGDHRPSSGPRLGRFGVGITAQAIKHGDVLTAETISADGNGSIRANWAEMLRRGDWYYPEPEWRPALGRPTGTIITIKRLLKIPKTKDVDRAHKEIAERFYPGIASGRRITLNGIVIPLLAEPLLTDVIQETLIFDGGRVAKVRAGLLKPNQADMALRRVHVSYLHRVIKPDCGFGCDGYSGIENMFARVELNEYWTLTQFKDNIDETESEELEERLAEVLQPILEKCAARSMTIDLQDTIEAVHELLGDVAARPRRKKPPGPTPPPKPPGPNPVRIVTDSDVSPTGPVKKSRPRAKIQIEFPIGRDQAEKFGVGIVDREGKVHRVIMPRDNPEIADMLAERDVLKRARLIHRHVAALYVQSNPELDLEVFGKLVWLFISNTKIRSDTASVA